MSPHWPDTLQSKMRSMFAADNQRKAANAILSPVLAGTEGDRVAVACLKLADGDLGKLEECVQAALADYRDVLAWAEFPRQMQLGPSATAAQKRSARRSDAEEYTQWLNISRA
jgi:hypothetical protein